MSRKPKGNLPTELADVLSQVGKNLYDIRKQKGISQAELARKSRISVTTVNEIERKRLRDIRMSTLVSFARALNVHVSGFFEPSDLKINRSDQLRLLKASEDILRITRKISKDD